MSIKVTMICEDCLSRNYKTPKNKYVEKRLELKKFCPKCNASKIHKESK